MQVMAVLAPQASQLSCLAPGPNSPEGGPSSVSSRWDEPPLTLLVTLRATDRCGKRRREVPGDGGALTGGGPDLEAAAERREPVGHVPQARPHRGVVGVVTGPVVGHAEAQGAALVLNGDAGRRCPGVLGGVLERLEAAEIHRRLGVLAKP